MWRTLFFYVFLWIGLLATLPFLLLAEIAGLFSREAAGRFAEKTARIWGRYVIALSGSRVEVEGIGNIPETGPILFVGNHQSNFDIPLVLGYLGRPTGFLSKAELAGVPIVGRWMRHLHCVFMDRSHPRKAVEAISTAAGFVKSGHPVLVFPEGTRSGSSRMGPFKAGAFKIKTRSKAAVVPVAVDGTWRIQGILERGVHPARVKLKVLEPMVFEELSSRDTQAMADAVRARIDEVLENRRED